MLSVDYMYICAGVAHRAFENDMHALYQMRELFDFLPLSNKDPVPIRFTEDPKYGCDTYIRVNSLHIEHTYTHTHAHTYTHTLANTQG